MTNDELIKAARYCCSNNGPCKDCSFFDIQKQDCCDILCGALADALEVADFEIHEKHKTLRERIGQYNKESGYTALSDEERLELVKATNGSLEKYKQELSLDILGQKCLHHDPPGLRVQCGVVPDMCKTCVHKDVCVYINDEKDMSYKCAWKLEVMQ